MKSYAPCHFSQIRQTHSALTTYMCGRLEIIQVPILEDNYSFVVQVVSPKTRKLRGCFIVDPGEVEPILDAVADAGIGTDVKYILNTHHHHGKDISGSCLHSRRWRGRGTCI